MPTNVADLPREESEKEEIARHKPSLNMRAGGGGRK